MHQTLVRAAIKVIKTRFRQQQHQTRLVGRAKSYRGLQSTTSLAAEFLPATKAAGEDVLPSTAAETSGPA